MQEVRQGRLPHPEEGVRPLRLPRCQDQEFWMVSCELGLRITVMLTMLLFQVREGQEEEDNWHRQDEAS